MGANGERGLVEEQLVQREVRDARVELGAQLDAPALRPVRLARAAPAHPGRVARLGPLVHAQVEHQLPHLKSARGHARAQYTSTRIEVYRSVRKRAR